MILFSKERVILERNLSLTQTQTQTEDDFNDVTTQKVVKKLKRLQKKLLTRSQASEEEQKYDLEDFPACCHTGT